MKKKILIALLLLVNVIFVNAQEFIIDGIKYNITDTEAKTAETIDYVGTKVDVTIPAKVEYNGQAYDVTSIGDSSFFFSLNDSQLTSVVIPNSVTSIGDAAFSFNKLVSVVIPNSVINIGNYAFQGNKLINIVIPNSVTSIGDASFSGNELTSVTISNSVTRIGNLVFSSNKLTNVVIPNSVTSIGNLAFYENDLTSVVIPNSLISIGYSVFSDNKLTSIVIPNSVTSIGISAFEGNKLTSIVISNNLTNIRDAVFFNNELKSVIIPNSVTSIGHFAFQHNLLTSIVIPNSVTSIGHSAFQYNKLTSIISLSNDPATLIDVFDPFDNKENIDLKIPVGSLANYIAKNWIGFKSITEDPTLSTKNIEFTQQGFGLNITNNQLTISNSKNIVIKEIAIFNTSGKQVKNNVAPTTINIADLTSGMYIIAIKTTNGVTTKKFVKE